MIRTPRTITHKDKPWLSAHIRCTHDHSQVNWDEFVHYQRRAIMYNAANAEAGRQFSVKSQDVLMNA